MPEEVELGVHRLHLHDHFLEGTALLMHIGRSLVDHGLDVRRRDNHAGLIFLLGQVLLHLCVVQLARRH